MCLEGPNLAGVGGCPRIGDDKLHYSG